MLKQADAALETRAGLIGQVGPVLKHTNPRFKQVHLQLQVVHVLADDFNGFGAGSTRSRS